MYIMDTRILTITFGTSTMNTTNIIFLALGVVAEWSKVLIAVPWPIMV